MQRFEEVRGLLGSTESDNLIFLKKNNILLYQMLFLIRVCLIAAKIQQIIWHLANLHLLHLTSFYLKFLSQNLCFIVSHYVCHFQRSSKSGSGKPKGKTIQLAKFCLYYKVALSQYVRHKKVCRKNFGVIIFDIIFEIITFN